MKTRMFILLLAILIAACGKDNDDGPASRPPQGEVEEQEELPQVDDTSEYGDYRVLLVKLTPRAEDFLPEVTGTAIIKVRDDLFSIRLTMLSAGPGAHRQGILKGATCPTKEEPLLIPLDEDLESQMAGQGRWPRGSNYTYQGEGKFSLLLDDLRKKDNDQLSEMTKLGDREALALKNRTIVIYEAQAGILVPVACGKIRKINNEASITRE